MFTTITLKPSSTLVVRRAVSHLVGIALQAVADWQRQRQARAAFAALSRLDARTLRDLTIDRSELLSLAAEAAGQIEAQRERAGHRLLAHR